MYTVPLCWLVISVGLAVMENKSSSRVAAKGRMKLFVVMVVCYLVRWRLLFPFDINLAVTNIPKTAPLFYHIFMGALEVT
mgnify:CR=1 FL=1